MSIGTSRSTEASLTIEHEAEVRFLDADICEVGVCDVCHCEGEGCDGTVCHGLDAD